MVKYSINPIHFLKKHWTKITMMLLIFISYKYFFSRLHLVENTSQKKTTSKIVRQLRIDLVQSHSRISGLAAYPIECIFIFSYSISQSKCIYIAVEGLDLDTAKTDAENAYRELSKNTYSWLTHDYMVIIVPVVRKKGFQEGPTATSLRSNFIAGKKIIYRNGE